MCAPSITFHQKVLTKLNKKKSPLLGVTALSAFFGCVHVCWVVLAREPYQAVTPSSPQFLGPLAKASLLTKQWSGGLYIQLPQRTPLTSIKTRFRCSVFESAWSRSLLAQLTSGTAHISPRLWNNSPRSHTLWFCSLNSDSQRNKLVHTKAFGDGQSISYMSYNWITLVGQAFGNLTERSFHSSITKKEVFQEPWGSSSPIS